MGKQTLRVGKCKSTRAFEKARIDLALSYAPFIYQCQECGWPVADGYCCGYCGSTSPQGSYKDVEDIPDPVFKIQSRTA